MKELTFQEVLQVAGGLPDPATLDELTYRASEPAPADAQPPAPPPSMRD